MTFTLYDSVDAGQIPAGAGAIGYYADGPFANLGAVRARFPNARLLPILTSRGQVPSLKQLVGWQNGVEIDIESTDWEPGDAGAFARTAIGEGVVPHTYCSLSTVPAVVASLHGAGLQRHQVKLRSAHWTGQAHICSGIQTDWGTISADATQWFDKVGNLNCDVSECADDFLAGGQHPPPPPPPEGKYPTGQARAEIIIDYDKPVGHRLSVRGTSGSWRQGTDQQLELMQVGFWKSGAWRITGVPNNTKPLG